MLEEDYQLEERWSSEAKDLIQNLLRPNPKKRLGGK
jgi:hypothetical protein